MVVRSTLPKDKSIITYYQTRIPLPDFWNISKILYIATSDLGQSILNKVLQETMLANTVQLPSIILLNNHQWAPSVLDPRERKAYMKMEKKHKYALEEPTVQLVTEDRINTSNEMWYMPLQRTVYTGGYTTAEVRVTVTVCRRLGSLPRRGDAGTRYRRICRDFPGRKNWDQHKLAGRKLVQTHGRMQRYSPFGERL